MSEPAISIVIPTYNVESYITRCLDSIAAQTFTDVEVLLIDDCCTDGTINVVENLISQYDTPIEFRIIHHEHNQGVSAARNTGIKAARGEFIYFIDSDDTMSPDCLQLLFDAIRQRDDIEMAVGGVFVECDGDDWKLVRMQTGIYEKEIWAYYCQEKFYKPVWNKLTRRSFIEQHQLFFVEGIIHEDWLWSFEAVCHLKCIAVNNTITYTYHRHSGSLDTNPDAMLHNRDYSIVCAKEAEYVHGIPSMWMKKSVFLFMEDLRYRLYKEALEFQDKEYLEWNYQLIRNTPSWNTFLIMIRRCTKGSVFRSLHKMLPYKAGYKYYSHVVAKYAF